MPIYEYTCRGCGHDFELLVRGSRVPSCPACESEDLERHLSMPRVSSETTRGLAKRAARKRDQVRGKDRMHDQLQYERSHDRHG